MNCRKGYYKVIKPFYIEKGIHLNKDNIIKLYHKKWRIGNKIYPVWVCQFVKPRVISKLRGWLFNTKGIKFLKKLTKKEALIHEL